MSIDLYVFEPPGPASADAVHALIEETEESWEDLPKDPSPGLSTFLEQAELRWPEDANSPWATSPGFEAVAGRGTLLNLTWSSATTAFPELVAFALDHGLVVYDPQADELRRP